MVECVYAGTRRFAIWQFNQNPLASAGAFCGAWRAEWRTVLLMRSKFVSRATAARAKNVAFLSRAAPRRRLIYRGIRDPPRPEVAICGIKNRVRARGQKSVAPVPNSRAEKRDPAGN
jgi:hypothetical protein